MEESRNSAAAVIRLLDASLNRASEGARVVEDYARFVLDDPYLTRLAKTLRHGVAAAGAPIRSDQRLAVRDTRTDVGAVITTPSETQREDAWRVCLASLHRLQEALRSLEEYAKTASAASAAEFERLRYDAYTLAKALGAAERSRERLTGCQLYVLIACGDSAEGFETRIESLCEAGVDALQLRDKRAYDRTLADRARRMVAVTRRHGVISIVNDRPDLAAIAQADGVHVGQEELTVADARRVVGPDALIGVSTHSIDQAREAVLDGADYLGVGPTFPTPTKQFDAFPGVDFVRAVVEEISLPSFAIGGIGANNLAAVLEAGTPRVAVSSAVTDAPDPAAAVRELKSLLVDSSS